MRVNTRYINSTRGTPRGRNSGGVYVPCIYMHAWRELSLLLCLYDVFRAIINSLVCWFYWNITNICVTHFLNLFSPFFPGLLSRNQTLCHLRHSVAKSPAPDKSVHCDWCQPHSAYITSPEQVITLSLIPAQSTDITSPGQVITLSLIPAQSTDITSPGQVITLCLMPAPFSIHHQPWTSHHIEFDTSPVNRYHQSWTSHQT